MFESLRCDLTRFGLSAVMHLVHTERVTGRLLVDARGQLAGWADLHEGEVVAASCGASRGLQGFVELFLVPATFATFSARLPRERGLRPVGDGMAMIIEGCRLADEWARIEHLYVTVAHAPDADALASHVGLVPVLAELDGSRTVAVAVARAAVPRAGVVDPLRELLDGGTLSVAEGPSAATSENGYHEALEAGRDRVAAGAFREAAAHFREALVLRPNDPVAQQNLARVSELALQSELETEDEPVSSE